REGTGPRPGGPSSLYWPEEDGGSADVAVCLDAAGGLLAAVVATAAPERRGWHPYGSTDASGLAATGRIGATRGRSWRWYSAPPA
ncbi:MAG: hypothetical protein ACOC84_08995, partial [Actinomycetota bacterium]